MNAGNDLVRLRGPVLVVGASGFVGANLLQNLLMVREDAFGTWHRGDRWRLEGVPEDRLVRMDTREAASVLSVASRIRPRTLFDCSSYGSYPFEADFELIHATNYGGFLRIVETFAGGGSCAIVHAGTSSEYGRNAAAPREDAALLPNSHYAVSKAAVTQAIVYFGKTRGLPVVNLRLYSAYGPYEDSSRLIPTLCRCSLDRSLPVFARPEVSRDFVHVDDVVAAFARAALCVGPGVSGESFNIATGVKTTLRSLAKTSRRLFEIDEEARFRSEAGRAWDVDDWYGDPSRAASVLGWRAEVDLASGLAATRAWWRERLRHDDSSHMTKAVSR